MEMVKLSLLVVLALLVVDVTQGYNLGLKRALEQENRDVENTVCPVAECSDTFQEANAGLDNSAEFDTEACVPIALAYNKCLLNVKEEVSYCGCDKRLINNMLSNVSPLRACRDNRKTYCVKFNTQESNDCYSVSGNIWNMLYGGGDGDKEAIEEKLAEFKTCGLALTSAWQDAWDATCFYRANPQVDLARMYAQADGCDMARLSEGCTHYRGDCSDNAKQVAVEYYACVENNATKQPGCERYISAKDAFISEANKEITQRCINNYDNAMARCP